MKLSPELESAFNEHMKAEYFSAHLYRNIVAYFEDLSLDGFVDWFVIQYKEETTHGDRFFKFIVDNNNRAKMLEIEGPKRDFDSPLDAFQYGLVHEKYVTASIHNLWKTAQKTGEIQCLPFLELFITEQIEEEDNFQTIVDRLILAEGDNSALLDMDRELAKRD